MPQVNLKSLVAAGKSVAGQVSGSLENVAGAAGKGAFSVSAGPNGISISANFNEIIKNKVRGNRTASQLKSLYIPNGGKVYKPIIYPVDLDDDHYMIFNVMERKRNNRQEKGTTRTIRSIVLPIPLNLSTQYNAEYQNESLGVFGAMAAGRINAADLKSAAGDISNLISSKIQAASDAFKAQDLDAGVRAAGIAGPFAATAAATAGAGAIGGLLALGGTSGGVISGIGVSEGLAINPHMAVLFQGVGFREHSFSYKLLARNITESRRINELISVFKYHMHPNYKIGNLAFEYPDEFEIDFSSKLQPYMYKIGTCVLKGFTVNYSTEGTNAFYDSGAPVSLEISMTFQETKIITKDNLDDLNVVEENYLL
jgi:hypothetical protein